MAKRVQTILQPLNKQSFQCYLGTGLHTLGLLGWILEQTGRANVLVTTFSTSEEFLSGFYNLRKKGLIFKATMLADLKASKKTVKLEPLMRKCFDEVYLASNHSKILIVTGAKNVVSVVSSQNNTYGGRAECTFITTDTKFSSDLGEQTWKLIDQSVKIDGIHERTTAED